MRKRRALPPPVAPQPAKPLSASDACYLGAAEAMKFGARLRRLRADADMSQADLCRIVGMAKGYLSDLENDKREPGAGKLFRLAQALKVSMDFLWTGK